MSETTRPPTIIAMLSASLGFNNIPEFQCSFWANSDVTFGSCRKTSMVSSNLLFVVCRVLQSIEIICVVHFQNKDPAFAERIRIDQCRI